ncbi:hypothetical protein BJ878DRAFT_493256 [Calycina marina]|uniref:J domain-containing protein n=1 Tax=Calycina marina TaxID=1763456 RepID=A0A9P7Z801_9HELO|nr:hypothetical protein BJ878DRAFT_493256 [Calycina marina]
MNRLFNKTDKKPKKTSALPKGGIEEDSQYSSSSLHSPSITINNKPHSPLKKSASSRSSRETDAPPQPHRSDTSSSHKSRTGTFKSGSSRRKADLDLDTHPLNLSEAERKRLSALSMMSDPMEVDGENPVSASSPPTTIPSAFDAPTTKVNGGASVNGNANTEGPAPPPHKSNPTSPAAPIAPTTDEAEAFKAAGNKFFKEKQYKKAIEEYTKAVEAQPSNAIYLSNRAAAFMSAGHYQKALEDCLRADELNPHNAKILLRMARAYISLGQAQDALDTFARITPPPSAKDVAPAKSQLQYINVAEDALKNGTTGSMALHALDQAEKFLGLGAPKPRKWQLMRGEAYLKMGNVNALGDAQGVAMNLLRNNNQDPEALLLRGRALYAQGDNEKAIQHFRQALNCDPDYRDAVKYLRMVQKLDRLKTEGNAEYKASRWASAIDKYQAALEVDPLNKGTNSKILQNRALCRIQLKDYKGAIVDCEKAISIDPSYTKAKKTKANALGQSGNWEEAVRELKSLAEANPDDTTLPKEIRKAELELKKSKRKDYYKILGVDKDSNDNDIKKAYRKAAIVHHPDKNPGDDDAAQRFQDIGEAYETLSDPEKRARYDSGEDLIDPMEGFGGGGGGGGMGGGMGGIDPEILMQMFGAQMGGGGRGGGSFGGMPGGGARQAQGGFPGGFQFQ